MPFWNDLIETYPILEKILILIVGVLVILWASRLLQRGVTHRIQSNEARYNARKGISFVSYLVLIIFAIGVFSNQLASLGVALGVAGAGIAFALQEVIASVAGWLAISFGQYYSVGDRVKLGQIRGDVIDIGILRTTLMEIGDWIGGDAYNGKVVRISNSFVFKEPVFNYSADFPFLWDEIKVPIKYGSDYQLVRTILQRVADEVVGEYAVSARVIWDQMVRKYMIEKARIEPAVTLAANDNWVEFTLRYVVDYKQRRSTKDILFTRLLEEIDRVPDKVGIASATFQLVEAPALDIRLEFSFGITCCNARAYTSE